MLDPEPLYEVPSVKFRMAEMAFGECSASECSLISNDYWARGYGRILMVPRVKLAYDPLVFDVIHPPRHDVQKLRPYQAIGGLKDNPYSDPQDRVWFGGFTLYFFATTHAHAVNQGPMTDYSCLRKAD